LQVSCEQVNAEELVNDPQFLAYSNYKPWDVYVNYSEGYYGNGNYGGIAI
jgi:hypothetical protein